MNWFFRTPMNPTLAGNDLDSSIEQKHLLDFPSVDQVLGIGRITSPTIGNLFNGEELTMR